MIKIVLHLPSNQYTVLNCKQFPGVYTITNGDTGNMFQHFELLYPAFLFPLVVRPIIMIGRTFRPHYVNKDTTIKM